MNSHKTHRTILVDDEQKSVDILVYLIQKHCPSLHIVATFNNPLEALSFIKETPIDVLLLDVQMPEVDGFQLLDRLPVIDFNVVFVTAFDEYALRAFRYFAIDYLLKPVEVDELKRMVNRLNNQGNSKYSKSDFDQIISRLAAPQPTIQHLAVPTSDGIEFMLFEDIMRLEADSNYTHIIKQHGSKIYASKTLKYFENLLPPNIFFRPHQSHLINVRFMDRFVRQDGGYILMKDKTQIGLARSKRQEFIDRFI